MYLEVFVFPIRTIVRSFTEVLRTMPDLLGERSLHFLIAPCICLGFFVLPPHGSWFVFVSITASYKEEMQLVFPFLAVCISCHMAAGIQGLHSRSLENLLSIQRPAIGTLIFHWWVLQKMSAFSGIGIEDALWQRRENSQHRERRALLDANQHCYCIKTKSPNTKLKQESRHVVIK